MKVLVFTSLFPNHSNPDFGIFIKNRVLHVSKLKDCSVVVVAPVPYCPPWKILDRWYRFSQIRDLETIDGIKVYHPKYFLIPKICMMFHGFFMYMGSCNTVTSIRKKFSFDLIDAHYVYPDGFAATILARRFDVPIIVTARGSDIHQFSLMRHIRPFLRSTLKQSQAVISVCRALKQIMIDLNCPSEKIRVIPNGVDVNRFKLIYRKNVRKKLGLSQDKKIILSVGSLIPLKGHHLVINAVKAIKKDVQNVHLFIAGKGEYRKSLEQQIDKLGLREHVTLLGHVPNSELRTWYNAADVFCLASAREGWANVIMESMACGTPVVATNVFGAPEIITSPSVGTLVKRESTAIAQSLADALKRDWDRELILNHVRSRSWNVVAEDVRQVFETVITEWRCR